MSNSLILQRNLFVACWQRNQHTRNILQCCWSSFSRADVDCPSEYALVRKQLQRRIAHEYDARISQTQLFTSRADPLAKRPNAVCDPYGQGGQPLKPVDATRLLGTLENGWRLEQTGNLPPLSLSREFLHPDYLSGAKFVHRMAAVAEINNHFPVISLERRLLSRQKAWQVVTTVKCRTEVLQGLSHNDFHIAMLMDAELVRPEVKALVREAEPPGPVNCNPTEGV